MSIKTQVHDLKTNYIAAWNVLDYEGMAALFTEPAAYVLSDGPRYIQNRETLAQSLKKQFAVLDVNGFDHTEIDRIEVRACNDTTAVADMRTLRDCGRMGPFSKLLTRSIFESCKRVSGN